MVVCVCAMIVAALPYLVEQSSGLPSLVNKSVSLGFL